MMRQDLESNLAEFLAQPSEENFSRLFESTSPMVYTICLRLLRSEEDAADAMQATYERLVRTVRSGEHIPEGIDGSGWVALMARREADNLRHRRQRRATREREASVMGDAKKDNPREELASREFLEIVERELQELPEDLAAIVSLHLLHGMSQKDLAAMFEVNQSSISRRFGKGLLRLRRRLKKSGLKERTSVLGVMGTVSWIAPPAEVSASILKGGGGLHLVSDAPLLGLDPTLGIFGGAAMKGKLVLTGVLVFTVVLITTSFVFYLSGTNDQDPQGNVSHLSPQMETNLPPEVPPPTRNTTTRNQEPGTDTPPPDMANDPEGVVVMGSVMDVS
ncbi:MAG: sigma-70 family RNA polymerase sigma factor, partial [Candidatus Sumerlaeia bacterium]|nr:sigma-70 family RNA polymerase sigma factor [Candidatus Sumerlaeia bacterium]